MMYNDFFKLNTTPFSLTPNPNFFCQLKGHQEALNTLHFCIANGEGFIKIIGEVGTGKTLLCRKLLAGLEETYLTAYIPNPDLAPLELRKAFAREIGLDPNIWQDQHELLTAVNEKLIKLYHEGKRVVLIVDEAQALSDESLETLRLLTNLETENIKLMQVVLFAQPELDQRLHQNKLRQLKQRITFSYILPVLNREDLDIYLNHRLSMAGYTHGNLFTKKARNLLFKASAGIPRLVNILAHKSLLVAYGKGEHQIDHTVIKLAVNDTDALSLPKTNKLLNISLALISCIMILVIFACLRGIS